MDKGTQGFNVIKFLLVRQTNKENGKLRPNAVPPRHDRILQLAARDGSGEKYEAKAKKDREDATAFLSEGAGAEKCGAAGSKRKSASAAASDESAPAKAPKTGTRKSTRK